MVATIPSPSFNSIDIGPLSLNIYGLAIAVGVVAAVWMFGRRLEQREFGTSDDASAIAVWAVLAGVIGARLYHVATDWDRFEDDYGAIPKLWEGGLGIPGGLLLGIPVGLYMARRRGIPLSIAATCAAPAIPLAQAIGRIGNYFNQELYGGPTDLPWALEIDADHLVVNPSTGELFAVGTTFHPTFLYEALWSLATVALLLYVDRRWRPSGGSLMGLFIAAYGLGRFWVEGLRVDPADEIGPLRWNQWVALAAFIVGIALFLVLRRRPDPEPPPHADEIDDEATATDVDEGRDPHLDVDADRDAGADRHGVADRLDEAGERTEAGADSADADVVRASSVDDADGRERSGSDQAD